MATKCSGCGIELGMFKSKNDCSEGDCAKVYCNACAKTYLKDCKDCDYTFCPEHQSAEKHDCKPEDQEEEDNSSDSNVEVTLSENERVMIVSYQDYSEDIQEVCDTIDKAITEGYTVGGWDNGDSFVWLTKQ